MLDIKYIKDNLHAVKQMLYNRAVDIDLDHLLNLYDEYKVLKQHSEELSAKRNKIAKQIGELKRQNQDVSTLLAEVSYTKDQENHLINEADNLYKKINNLLLYIPNMLASDVPCGKDEADNQVIKQVGEIPQFKFKPLEHFEIAEALDMMDFKSAANMAGTRFVTLKGDIARLERALANFMLDTHIAENGYQEYSVPVLLKPNALFNTAQLPKFHEDLFKTDDDRYLISTTEIPLTNLFQDTFIDTKDLPQRLVAKSLCFRSEAGARGRDTKGMLRQHQFLKVELVSVTQASQSENELQYMLSCVEGILHKLKLPYQVVLLCSGDTGFASAKTYDVEVWLPGQGVYKEISSCSNCLDFQARRMNAKLKEKHHSKYELLHTLNGSGLAVGRTLVAVLENYQQTDGSIIIPEVLRSYMGGQTIIK